MKHNSGLPEKSRIFRGYGKISRALAIAVVLPLLAVLIPATPALAAPVINLSPTSGSVGTKVTVTGENFESYIGDYISILFNNTEIDSMVVPDSGSFTIDFNIPDIAPGVVYVIVEDEYGNPLGDRKPFVILKTEIEGLYPKSGAVGTIVTINGQGFYANWMVTFYYYNGIEVNVGTKAATPTGELTYSFIIPESTAGNHEIEAQDILGNSAKASFKVLPSATLNPTSGAFGDKVTVSGTGFGYRSRVTIYLDDGEVARDKTNECGSFEVTFDVPVMRPDTYNVEVEDNDGNTGNVEFTIIAGASLSQTTGNVGTIVIVSGTGFKVDEKVTIKYDDTEVTEAIASRNGAFSIAFNVPASIGGNHMITITDGTNIVKRTFTMESTAPPIPQPLLPEDASKAEAETYFDWEDVIDDSGVTYTLQIALDADFTSIVLEKEGLTYSDYTITKGEGLQPTIKEAPYYWRVKAVDGASNESEWSTTRSFYVASSFALPGWALFTLIGLGVVMLGFLCFWLGRRTLYSK